MKNEMQSQVNEGDLVLDPFMGGGTTLAVAEVRLQKQMDMFSTSCTVLFHKYNYNKLRCEGARG